MKLNVSWDLSRLPAAMLAAGALPSPQELLPALGGTTMIGTLRATFEVLPSVADILKAVPEILQPRQGKQLVGISALPSSDRSVPMRGLAMELKRAIGMKGTRVVFPPSRRSDLSTAQLLHNRLPKDGTAIFFLASPGRVDLVTVEAIQDIAAYARRDRGRPHADPGTGMLPPKLAQMLLNASLVPPDGTVYDPFCGVGTIPMEALLLGLKVVASDASPKQAERTRENLVWLTRQHHASKPHVFVHDVSKGAFPLAHGSVDAVVTEGWLGPARSHAPLPREAEEIFSSVSNLLAHLLSSVKAVLKSGGTVLVTVPAFRIGKRVVRFPVESVRAAGFLREPLIPNEWKHPLFREASSGTLLYGRPSAMVLREVVRYRKA